MSARAGTDVRAGGKVWTTAVAPALLQLAPSCGPGIMASPPLLFRHQPGWRGIDFFLDSWARAGPTATPGGWSSSGDGYLASPREVRIIQGLSLKETTKMNVAYRARHRAGAPG